MFAKKVHVNLFGAPNQILNLIFVICDSWEYPFVKYLVKGEY